MKSWRNAASIILATSHKQKVNSTLSSGTNLQYDYKLLSMKRHKDSSFLPGNYVFPGGMVEPADADLKWQKLFTKFGYDSNSYASLLIKKTEPLERPPIFKSNINELPREISLRITAIRETFEECGILICRKESGSSSRWAEHLQMPQGELENWLEKVHNDAHEFYKMCESLHCYPDLWTLYEWSNWRTPAHLSKRYDSIFFMTCLNAIPEATYDTTEMEELRWDTPSDLLNLSRSLAPPQIYEVAEISKFQQCESLLNAAIARDEIGAELHVGTRLQLLDGQVVLFPGDSMYFKDLSSTEGGNITKINMSIDEFRNSTKRKNRIEFGKIIRVISDNLGVDSNSSVSVN